MKRIFLVGTLVVVTALLSVAASTAQTQPVTLTFLGTVESRAGWDVVIANFERAYPNIKIDDSYVPGSQFGPLLLTQLQAGTPPDLFTIQPGAGSNYGLYALGSQGKLLDLTGSPWTKRVPKAAQKLALIKNRVYGFQATYTTVAMLYNTKLFGSLALTAPTKFSELLGMCRKIAATGKVPVALGAASPNAVISLLVLLAANNVYGVDPTWNVKRLQHKTTFAGSALWKRVMQSIVEMRDSGCFPPSPAAVTASAQYAMMASEQAVMMPSTSGEIAVVKQINSGIQVKQFAWPADNAKDTKTVLASAQSALVVAKATAHPNEAKVFVNFIARPKQNSLLNRVGSTLAGDDVNKGIIPDFAQPLKPLFVAGRVQSAFISTLPYPNKGIVIPNFTGQITGLFTGQRTSQQILEFIDALWDAPAGG
jgi:raffinose/stachyose/melibiose transport system substrate-binding protein